MRMICGNNSQAWLKQDGEINPLRTELNYGTIKIYLYIPFIELNDTSWAELIPMSWLMDDDLGVWVTREFIAMVLT